MVYVFVDSILREPDGNAFFQEADYIARQIGQCLKILVLPSHSIQAREKLLRLLDATNDNNIKIEYLESQKSLRTILKKVDIKGASIEILKRLKNKYYMDRAISNNFALGYFDISGNTNKEVKGSCIYLGNGICMGSRYFIKNGRDYWKDLTKYVIVLQRHNGNECGIYSDIFVFMATFFTSMKKKMPVVIDMRDIPNPYIKMIGVENAWEFYYKQPDGISLEEAENMQHVYSGEWSVKRGIDLWGSVVRKDKNAIGFIHNVYRHYVVLNDVMQNKVDTAWKQIRGGLIWGGENLRGKIQNNRLCAGINLEKPLLSGCYR